MQLHVARTAADGEPRAQRDVGTGDQRTDERRQLGRIHRAVAVERNDDVPFGRLETGTQCEALARLRDLDGADVRTNAARNLHRVVPGQAVDDDHFRDPGRNPLEHAPDIPLLVQCRYDNADRWLSGADRAISNERSNRVPVHATNRESIFVHRVVLPHSAAPSLPRSAALPAAGHLTNAFCVLSPGGDMGRSTPQRERGGEILGPRSDAYEFVV